MVFCVVLALPPALPSAVLEELPHPATSMRTIDPKSVLNSSFGPIVVHYFCSRGPSTVRDLRDERCSDSPQTSFVG